MIALQLSREEAGIVLAALSRYRADQAEANEEWHRAYWLASRLCEEIAKTAGTETDARACE